MKIPFLSFSSRNLDLKSESLKLFEDFFDSEYYVLGKFTKQFEEDYAYFSQTKYAVGVSNGLDAIHLALKSLGVTFGDEVIIPSNTYIATALAVTYTGAKPVFVEPDEHTFNINPEQIEKLITDRTKVIIPVHLYGQPCEMDKIISTARKYDLSVVEDNAQAHGAKFKGQVTGSFGDINATSFYPSKNIGALGEAGALTTDNESLAEKVKMFRNYGSRERYYNEVIGYNNRIDELQAGILTVSLKYIEKWTFERQKIASWYFECLKNVSNIELPKIVNGAVHVYHLFVIKVERRDDLQKYLNEKGVGTLIHYPVPPYLQKAYEHLNYKRGHFPIADKLSNSCLSLPLYVGLQKEQIQYIASVITDFYDK